jgi:hypothetical protein
VVVVMVAQKRQWCKQIVLGRVLLC